MSKLIVAAAVGDCVHVAGVLGFLQLAEEQGFRTVFLGPATPVDRFCEAVTSLNADFAAVGYRLGPIPAGRILRQLKERVQSDPALARRRWLLGGTPTVAAEAEEVGLFEAVFSGREDLDVVIAWLKAAAAGGGPVSVADVSGAADASGASGASGAGGSNAPGGSHGSLAALGLVERIAAKSPYPLIRHHFGLPTLAQTVEGVRRIAGAGVLDVISLGPDQNAQASFFRPEEQDPDQDGAGGVPIRSAADLLAIREASRNGNYPLLRCYSGTRDLRRMAPLLASTIGNAWAAIPLFWYDVLDGRSPRGLREAIAENQATVRWHAEAGIPVEMNEAHHWSLRDAPDVVAVAAAYLAAHNAKAMGVRDYVAQLMLNTPPRTSARMDLAKMLAKMDLIETLAGPDFRVYRQVRAGLSSFPTDLSMARGHLAHATSLGMALKPHIVHVVGYCEADHVATADDVIESCRIARGAIRSSLDGLPDPTADPAVAHRREVLRSEALRLIRTIAALAPAGVADPLADPAVLTSAVTLGYLDAPHLKGNPAAAGRVVTRMVDGACLAVDPASGKPLSEQVRLAGLGASARAGLVSVGSMSAVSKASTLDQRGRDVHAYLCPQPAGAEH